MLQKKFCMQGRKKYFEKLKPEPGPTRKLLPDLQLRTMSKVSF